MGKAMQLDEQSLRAGVSGWPGVASGIQTGLAAFLRSSYALVRAKLPKKMQLALGG